MNLNNGSTGHTWGINFNNYYNGYFVNRYDNPDVTWEVAEKSNYGIELGLFDKVMIMATTLQNTEKISTWKENISLKQWD